jgi:hypothetical protein
MNVHTHSSTELGDQSSFARHNFDNHQAIIRSADAKAGVLLTVLLFVIASTIPLGRDVLPKLRWISGTAWMSSTVFIASYFALCCGFFWSLYLIAGVVSPRGARYYPSPKVGHDLLFYGHVLMHKDSAHYFDAVSKAPPELILRNLTDQVFELASIAQDKMAHLKRAQVPIRLALCAWLVNLTLGLWISR